MIDILCALYPPQDDFNPGQKLHGLKGLHNIVFRTQAEAAHLVRQFLLGCNKNYGNLRICALLHNLKAAHARQHHIQQHQVKIPMLHFLKSFRAVGAHHAFVAADCHRSLYQLCDIGIVFCN